MAQSCPHLRPENYLQSLQGRLIYKDQCSKCFHDPRNSNGLDLCLKCLIGSCRSEHQHSKLHHANANHPIALNIKLIPKEIEIEQQTDLTRLAIGKPGGASADQVEYDEVYQLRCLACDIDLDNSLLSGVINSVKQENSAFKKQDICEWELSIFPCEHTLTLNQIPKSLSQGLQNCHQCDLSTNLWLCLVCGNVGCGRKNYDGTGGNGHAVAHSQGSHHCLVVKLGTITAEGSASIYCYSCDNDVSDDNLAQHLGTFGINVAEQRKTEKTMTEMNIDANRTLTLSSIIEEGKVLHPLFGENNTGIANIGNSCYINSVLQSLFSFPEYRQRYSGAVAEEHLKTCTKFAVECLTCQLSKLGTGLLSGEFSQKKEVKIIGQDGKYEELPENSRYSQEGVAINDLRQLIGKNHPEFKTKQMQDALEYLQYFLDHLDKEEKKTQQDKLQLGSLFQFKSQNKLTCLSCNGVKLVNSQTNELKLPVPPPTEQQLAKALEEQQNKGKDSNKLLEEPEYSLEFNQCLEQIISPEVVDLQCPRCNKKTSFSSVHRFSSLPQYLLLPTNRLFYDNWVPKKLNAIINVPLNIDLLPICVTPLANGEVLLKDNGVQQEQQQQPQVDMQALSQLLDFGFGENRATRALLKFSNNAEIAMNFLFENQEDMSLDLPIEPIKSSASAQSSKKGFYPNQEDLSLLESMGFENAQCRLALQKFANNVELALDALSNGQFFFEEEVQNKEEISESKMEVEQQPITAADYTLQSVIVHLGKSVHAGHYVSYINREGKWVYFNDAKVAYSDEPSLGKGYIYIYKKN